MSWLASHARIRELTYGAAFWKMCHKSFVSRYKSNTHVGLGCSLITCV